MISVLVLAPPLNRHSDDVLEVTARSLVWLVSAVVVGVVRDVVLAAPPGLGLAAVADQVGCGLTEMHGEARLLQAGLEKARCGEVLVLRAGYEPQGDLVREIEVRCRSSARRPSLLLAGPQTFVERLLPNRAPVIGVVTAKSRTAGTIGFSDLVRGCGKAERFATRVQPIP